jgi:hypothetical protein
MIAPEDGMDTDELTEMAYDTILLAHEALDVLSLEIGASAKDYLTEDEFLRGTLIILKDILADPESYLDSWNYLDTGITWKRRETRHYMKEERQYFDRQNKPKIHDAKFNEYTPVAYEKNSSGLKRPFPGKLGLQPEGQRFKSSPRCQTYQGVTSIRCSLFFLTSCSYCGGRTMHFCMISI